MDGGGAELGCDSDTGTILQSLIMSIPKLEYLEEHANEVNRIVGLLLRAINRIPQDLNDDDFERAYTIMNLIHAVLAKLDDTPAVKKLLDELDIEVCLLD